MSRPARNEVALNEAAERVTAGSRWRGVIPMRGSSIPAARARCVYGEGSEAVAAVRIFESLGIPPARIIAEEQSRNTVENAVFSLLLAMPQPGERWLLVTSGYHMPRAMGIFRRAGFPVEAYPVDWRTRGPQDACAPIHDLGQRAAARRYRRARVGRPSGLLADRPLGGAVSGTARPGLEAGTSDFH